MANIYAASDWHLGHANMLNFKREDGSPLRDFTNLDEMNSYIIQKHNEVVKTQDHFYMLGDVAMKREHIALVAKLNGHKRLVRGNHDIYRTKEYLPYFDEIYGIRVLDGMIFTHIPIHPESLGRFKANVHGHIHANKSPNGPYINVSVEAIDYTPVSLEELKAKAEKLKEG